MRKFEETLLGLQGRAMFPEEDGPTIERDRQRCERALEALAADWASEPRSLSKLRSLTKRALELYSDGQIDAGAGAAKEVFEFLFEIQNADEIRD